MKKRLSQFIIIVLCLVSTLVISKINTQAATSVNNGVNYETYTVSNLGLVKTQDAYVVKNVIYSFFWYFFLYFIVGLLNMLDIFFIPPFWLYYIT